MADFYVPKYGGYKYKNEDDEESTSSGSRKSSSMGKDGFYTPSYSMYEPTKKEKQDADNKKRLDDLASIEANAPQGKNFFEGAGDFLKGAGKAIADPFTRIGKGTANVIGEITGENQRHRDNLQSRADQTQEALLEQIKLSKDPNRTEEQREASRNLVKQYTKEQNDIYAEQRGESDRVIEENDPTKAAGAIASIGLDVATAGTLSTATKAAKTAQALTTGQKVAKTAKAVGSGAAIGAGYGTSGALMDKGSDVNAGDIAQGALIGGALGGAAPLAVKGAIAGAKALRGTSKSSKLASQTAQEAAEDVAKLESAGIKPATQKAATEALDDVAPDGTVIPGSQVGQAVENVATKAGETAPSSATKATRYTSKTLPDSDFVGAETKSKLGAEYETTSNAQRADTALQKLDIDGVDNFTTTTKERLSGKQITDQTVFDAQAAAQALEKRGTPRDLQDAADIYNKLSEHLSKAGQTVQAASIMSRQTPQGLSYFAQKQFKNAGVEFTPKLQKELKSYIDAVKNAPPKSEEMAIARDNVQYFIAQNIPSSKADKIVNFWRSGLLTSPTTSGGAIVGNVGQIVTRKLLTNPTATLADWTTSFFTGKRSQTLAKFGELEKGAKKGVENATSKQYWKTGYDPSTAGKQTRKYDEKNRMLNYGQTPLGKATGRYVNGVYQLMGALDQPFRQGAIRESLSSIARAEVMNQGLKGKAAKEAYDNLMNDPPTEMLERATAEGEREVFANDTVLSKAIQGVKNKFRADGHEKAAAFVDFLVPFSKVPSAIVTRLIDQTPIGTGKEIVKQIVNVRKGGAFDQRAMSRAIGEGTAGVPIIGAGLALANSGLITGGYPSTKAERDQWKAEGKQPNSVKIGDRWYSFNYLQPFGTLLAVGKGMSDAKKSGANTSEMISEALATGGKSFLDQSFLQGISTLIDAVENPAEFGGRYVANTAASTIPNFIRAAVRASDPYQRETEGFLAGIASGVPGLRDTLPIKLDKDGNPIEAKDNFANQYFNPFKPSRSTPDENTALQDQAISPASRLKSKRMGEINDLLGRSKVQAAQRKIDEYNEEVAKVIAPYINANKDTITKEQLDRIEKLFLGEVWINKKGRPTISSRDDLPK